MGIQLTYEQAVNREKDIKDELERLKAKTDKTAEDHAKVRTLLASREDIFDDYTQDGFEAAFSALYDIEDRQPVPGSERTLYLLRRR